MSNKEKEPDKQEGPNDETKSQRQDQPLKMAGRKWLILGSTGHRRIPSAKEVLSKPHRPYHIKIYRLMLEDLYRLSNLLIGPMRIKGERLSFGKFIDLITESANRGRFSPPEARLIRAAHKDYHLCPERLLPDITLS